jgi:hypothetical protein
VYLFGPFTKPNHVRGLFDEPLSDKLYIYINIYIYIYIYIYNNNCDLYNLDTLGGPCPGICAGARFATYR